MFVAPDTIGTPSDDKGPGEGSTVRACDPDLEKVSTTVRHRQFPVRGGPPPPARHLGASYLQAVVRHSVVRFAPYGGSVAPIRHHPLASHERIARGRRDASLVRVGTVTKTIGAGIVATVGVLGFYVAKAFPGHHTSTPTAAATAPGSGTGQSSTPSAAPTTTPSVPGTAAPGTASPTTSPSLTPPTSPPVRTSAPPTVVSGAT